MEVAEREPDGVVRVRAANASPLTLDGTNTYVVGAWVVDPGPSDAAHLQAVRDAAGGRVEGVVLTHSHSDHSEGAEMLAAPVTLPAGGEEVGPFRAVADSPIVEASPNQTDGSGTQILSDSSPLTRALLRFVVFCATCGVTLISRMAATNARVS